jgi:hypothetical protein
MSQSDLGLTRLSLRFAPSRGEPQIKMEPEYDSYEEYDTFEDHQDHLSHIWNPNYDNWCNNHLGYTCPSMSTDMLRIDLLSSDPANTTIQGVHYRGIDGPKHFKFVNIRDAADIQREFGHTSGFEGLMNWHHVWDDALKEAMPP